ncbi:somatostatin receptor type 2 [Agrilus planipennis]|uniref:Somatostatin receptor type 2 n=1 Tax=Agrilus planipennis TaxID=224129 RepID=A0A1W4XHH6_AGRPL|nr:somatostatin receptor type 2 [Agrilus planipennis]XP_018335582.1 somatostatin receptor type 2 [Agrilus planipennis]
MDSNVSDFYSNATENYNSEFSVYSMTFIFQQVVLAIVCCVGLLGNTLVIYVVLKFSKMQTVTNMYIVNLAIADECFLIGVPFIIVTSIKKSWIFGGVMCKAYMILTSINQYASSIFLFIMSADRYVAVCHPISSPKWRTPIISRIVSLCAWICSITLISPILIYSTETEQRNGRNGLNVTAKTCQIVWSTDNSTEENFEEQTLSMAAMFILYTFVFSFAIPLCLISVFYCLVIQKLRNVGPKNKSKEKRRSHRKVTNLVLTVVTVYVLCWLPYWILQLAMIASQKEPSHFVVTLNLLASCLSYSNSAVNPILYAFLSDNFKKSFLKACTCAAGKEINATLQLENSVFPRKSKLGTDKFRPSRATSICPTNGEDCDVGLLVSKTDASTSKTNVTFTTENKTKDTIVRNGIPSTPNSATNL